MKYVENLESVNKKITILNEGLKITEDAILLSKFIKKYNKKSGEFLEIGAGQGIISILISEISKVSKIFAVEIQKEIFEILGKNIKNNFLESKIIPINKNIKEMTGQFDVIFSNPPYKKINSGKLPKKESEKISKFEIFLTLKELFSEIKRLLKNYGEFFVIVPNDRLNEVFSYVYANKMNILEIEINKYKNRDLVILHGKKGGKNSEIKFL